MKITNRFWRGLTTITASLLAVSIGIGTICEAWKDTIDQYMGTTSSVIETDDTTIDGTYTYTSDYSTTTELVQTHMELNETLSEEGSVLLKNNGSLPLEKGSSVTLFGTVSHYPHYGGQMGGSVDESEAISLEAALVEEGFQVNQTMVDLYETMGNIVTSTDENGNDVYGYRPGEISINLFNFTGMATSGYTVGEPPLSVYEETDPDYADSFAEYSDAAIVVVGRPGTEAGDYQPGEAGLAEGASGSTVLALNDEERAVIQLACDNFDTVIVLINAINQMEIDELKANDDIDAVLWVGFPGCYGFNGVADILDGDANPSGHLSDTYAVDSQSSPAMENFGYISYTNRDNVAANTYVVEAEGIYVGYKYYETRYADSITGDGNATSSTGSSTGNAWNYTDEVSYSFGYGLSYTTFEQTLDSVVFNDDHTVTVTVTITNTGNVAGKDVAQIYAQSPYTDYDKENLVEKAAVQLMDYVKSDELQPGESQTLETTFDLEYLASYDYTNAKTYIMDAGDYYLALGNGAHDALNNILAAQGYTVENGMDYDGDASLTYTWTQDALDTTTFSVSDNGTAITNQMDNVDLNYWQPDTVIYLSRQDWEGTWPITYENLEINEAMSEYIYMDFYEIATDEDTSEIFPEEDNGVSFLTMKDLDFDDPLWDELLDQISLAECVYGIRAGGTQPKDYTSVDMIVDAYESDGPAGFTYSSLGARSSDESSSTYVGEDDPYYGYYLCDMVAEAVVASTFSKELAEAEGILFGNDSLWLNVTIFFAPAMNLHRTPYNSRNDEYYSEDSMLTYYTGKAVIEGTRTKGTLAVAKHFAFNDQESGRLGVSVFMTEQKAREGELRGFEGAVEGGALAIMSSFNRIGIIYSSAHTGVMQNILRGEWGYQGFLMTDMLVSQMSSYMTVKESVMAGTTLMGISSDSLVGSSGAWSYFTEDGVSGDADLCENIRLNTKYLLYAIANSNAMNGINETSHVVSTMTWWRAAYLGVSALFLIPTVIGIIKYVQTSRKSRTNKKEVQKS